MSQRRLVLISPCRDEAEHLERTIESVARQTLHPDLWVIVDDGSTDATPRLLAEAAARYPYIRVVTREDRGRRAVGPGVIDAFYAGYESVDSQQFEYLCKLDLDLDLPPRYFEILIERMDRDPRLGTCSGKPYYSQGGHLLSEGCGDENSAGMSKLYRRTCFEQIGGFVREVMWDGIDGHRCRMLGWCAISWDEPDLRVLHLRPMGSSDRSIWRGRFRHGYGQYFMGTHPLYMMASAAFRMTRRPYVTGGVAMLAGYFGSMWRGAPRYEDLEFRRFLRAYHWNCLFKGKASATRELNRRQASAFHTATQGAG